MRNKCILFIVLILTLVFTPSVAKTKADVSKKITQPTATATADNAPYSFASQKIDGPLWGMDIGDDGRVVLLKRRSILIGRFENNRFVEGFECKLVGSSDGARVYLYDIDGDGQEEVVVSAVEGGIPSSQILKVADKGCRDIASYIRYSLRVIRVNGKKILLGQSSSFDSFFSGPIYTVVWDAGKLNAKDVFKVPRYVTLYQYEPLPAIEDTPRFAVIKGYNPLEVYEKKGKKFKRFWKTSQKFGGSVNILGSDSREVLGEIDKPFVEFDLAPIVYGDGKMVAIRHEMPIHGLIGKRPMVRGATIVWFDYDSVLGYRESSREFKLSGALTDAVLVERGGKDTLYVVMQEDPSMFREGGDRSLVLGIDLFPL